MEQANDTASLNRHNKEKNTTEEQSTYTPYDLEYEDSNVESPMIEPTFTTAGTNK
jgi:hypothetical protein